MLNKELIEEYIVSKGNLPERRFGLGINIFIKNWKAAKSKRLFELFGDNLILEKKVSIPKTISELSEEMERCCCYSPFTRYFEADLTNLLSSGVMINHSQVSIDYLVADEVRLAKNRLGDEITLENTETKKVLKLRKDEKLMRAIKRILNAFNFSEATLSSFEEYRNSHSMCLADKNISGTLCLSIHPMDYITMSDNNHNWESCMSWIYDGCYKAGTLELVNCENTIVAYLKSDNVDFGFYTYEGFRKWNSKKWRQLIHITDTFVIANRNYPFHSDGLSELALDWVRDLAKDNLDMDFLPELCNNNSDYQIRAITNHMYCDLGATGAGKYYKTKDFGKDIKRFNLGGEAMCLCCGDFLNKEDELVCSDCSLDFYCDCCGEYSEDEPCHVEGGEVVCESCLSQYYLTCSDCGKIFRSEDINQQDCLCDCCHSNR